MATISISLSIPDDMSTLTIEQINALSAKLDEARLEIRDHHRKVAEARNKCCLERELDVWGVTEQQWWNSKRQSGGWRGLQATLDALEKRYREVRANSLDEQYDEATRENLSRVAEEISEQIDDTTRKLEEERKKCSPMHTLLNKARRENSRSMRKVQQADALPANTGVKAQKLGK